MRPRITVSVHGVERRVEAAVEPRARHGEEQTGDRHGEQPAEREEVAAALHRQRFRIVEPPPQEDEHAGQHQHGGHVERGTRTTRSRCPRRTSPCRPATRTPAVRLLADALEVQQPEGERALSTKDFRHSCSIQLSAPPIHNVPASRSRTMILPTFASGHCARLVMIGQHSVEKLEDCQRGSPEAHGILRIFTGPSAENGANGTGFPRQPKMTAGQGFAPLSPS